MVDSTLPNQFSGGLTHPSIIPTDRIKKSKVKFGLAQSFSAALSGIIYTIQTQRNMKIHIFAALCVTLVSIFLDLNLTARAAILFSIALVFFAEIINTAMEAIVDLYVDRFHQFAMVAKDAAAGGVLMLSIITTLLFSNILWVHGQQLIVASKDPYALIVVASIVMLTALLLISRPPRILTLIDWMAGLTGSAYLGVQQSEPFFSAFACILITFVFLSAAKKPKRLFSQI